MEEITSETAAKISDANEGSSRKSLVDQNTGLNILNHCTSSKLYFVNIEF